MIHIKTKVVISTASALERKLRYVIHQGGTSSGKTYGIIIALVVWAKQQKEKKIITIAGQTIPHLNKGALRDFEEIVEELGGLGKTNRAQKVFYVGHCLFEFIAIDKLGKAKGGKRDVLFMNECNEINYKIYQQLEIRTNQTVILDYNPSSEFWLQETLIPSLKGDEYTFQRTTYRDNPQVADAIIRTLEAYKETDEQLYRVYALGLTGHLEGVIFDNVEYIDEMPQALRHVGYGMDFGFSNDPTVLVRCGVKGNGLYLEELLYKPGLTKNDIENELKNLDIRRSAEIYADPSEDRLIAELQQANWNITRATARGRINNGIDLLKRYKIYITKNSTNFRKEQKNYRWAEKLGKKTNKPIDAFNHCFDSLRYWAMYKIGGGVSALNPQGYSNRELQLIKQNKHE